MRTIRDVAAQRRGLVGFVAGVTLTLAVAGAGLAVASIPSTTTGTITACVRTSTGAIRVVDAQAGRRCGSGERALAWSAGFRMRGAWSAGTSYSVLDVVVAGGSSYLARAASKGKPPATTPSAWTLLAQRGSVGPRGTTGPSGAPGPGGLRGQQQFAVSGTWLAPPGVTSVLVELWGGGGGGGCGGTGDNGLTGNPRIAGAGGAGGGGGGYARAVVPVVPGTTYDVAVGLRGQNCTAALGPATDGDASRFSGPGGIDYPVPGGFAGGDGASFTAGATAGGTAPDSPVTGFSGGNAIDVLGNAGSDGWGGFASTSQARCGEGGAGGAALPGSIGSVYGAGGRGGAGSCTGIPSQDASGGQGGLVVLVW